MFSFRLLPEILYTNITYLVWISQLHTEIGVVHFSNEGCNVLLMFFNHKLATDITKQFGEFTQPGLDMFKAQHGTK
jgi:hypothetical protein